MKSEILSTPETDEAEIKCLEATIEQLGHELKEIRQHLSDDDKAIVYLLEHIQQMRQQLKDARQESAYWRSRYFGWVAGH